MRISKYLQKKSIRFLTIFIILIFILTFVSQVTSHMTVPKVSIVRLKRETLVDEMTFEGQVAKADSIPIFTLDGQKIEKIYVHANQEVRAETPLFKLEMSSIDKAITRLESEIQKLDLMIQTLENQEISQKNTQALRIKQALDNYQAIKETDVDQVTKQDAYNAWQLAKSETPIAAVDGKTAQIDRATLVADKDKLMQVKSVDGIINATTEGYVTGIFITEGKITTEEAALMIASKKSDNILVLRTQKTAQEYLKIGQLVTVIGISAQDVENEYDKASIIEASIDTENPEMFKSKLNLGQADFNYGSSAKAIVTKKSVNYPYCLPTRAVHESSQGYYVLVAKTKETMLGEEIIAEKIDVSLVDKTPKFSAIKANKLLDGRDILLEIDQSVEENTKVRIINTNET